MQKKNYYLESVLDLNASNVWGTEAQELLELWQKDIKEEGFSSSEEKVLNVIRLAFDVYHFDPKADSIMSFIVKDMESQPPPKLPSINFSRSDAVICLMFSYERSVIRRISFLRMATAPFRLSTQGRMT